MAIPNQANNEKHDFFSFWGNGIVKAAKKAWAVYLIAGLVSALWYAAFGIVERPAIENSELSFWITYGVPLAILVAAFILNLLLAPYEIYKEMWDASEMERQSARQRIADLNKKLDGQNTKAQNAYDTLSSHFYQLQERILAMSSIDVSKFGEDPNIKDNEISNALWLSIVTEMKEFGPAEVAILSNQQDFSPTKAPGDWSLIERGRQFQLHLDFLKFVAKKLEDFFKRTPRPTRPNG